MKSILVYKRISKKNLALKFNGQTPCPKQIEDIQEIPPKKLKDFNFAGFKNLKSPLSKINVIKTYKIPKRSLFLKTNLFNNIINIFKIRSGWNGEVDCQLFQ